MIAILPSFHFFLQLIRLDKPTGLLLTVLPAFLTLSLLGKLLTPLSAVVLLGGFATRSAGCLINDLCDRDLDRNVARTKLRLLASGKASLAQALAALAFFCALSLFAASFLPTHSYRTVLLTALMIALYPLSKRFFILPQLILGFTFAQGVILTLALSGQPFSLEVGVLYLAVVFWVFSFDSLYALADYQDDKKLSLHSSVKTIGPESIKTVIIATHLIAHSLISLLAICLSQEITTLLVCSLTLSSCLALSLCYKLLRLKAWSLSHQLFHGHILQGIAWTFLLFC